MTDATQNSQALVHRHLGIGEPQVDGEGNPIDHPVRFRIRMIAGDEAWDPSSGTPYTAAALVLAVYDRQPDDSVTLTIEALE